MSAAQISRFARGAQVGSALLFLATTCVCVDSASAQIFQWTPEQLTKYTAKIRTIVFPTAGRRCPMTCSNG